MPHQTTEAGYTLSDDPARFDLARAHDWIGSQSYWGQGIPFDTFARACAGSLTVGAFAPDGAMAAMARVVTDRATFGWVCDVFVDPAYRGAGLGKMLMRYIRAHPDLHLATRDAHGLYRQFGFTELTKVENWMEIRDPDVYSR